MRCTTGSGTEYVREDARVDNVNWEVRCSADTPSAAHRGSPLIVYTVDSPVYPDRMFGLSPFKRDHLELHGSVIYIGGGISTRNRESHVGECSVSEAHLIAELGTVGQHFAERATQAFVMPDERVILQRSGELASAAWIAEARRAGFECAVTEHDVVCLGTGVMLGAANWLQGAFDWDDVHLIASRRPLSVLESALLAGASGGADLRSLVAGFLYRAYIDPVAVQRELGGYDVFAGLVGLRGEYLAINRADATVDRVEEVFRQIAVDLGVELYYGGSAVESSATSDLFGPLPGSSRAWRHWQRIA